MAFIFELCDQRDLVPEGGESPSRFLKEPWPLNWYPYVRKLCEKSGKGSISSEDLVQEIMTELIIVPEEKQNKDYVIGVCYRTIRKLFNDAAVVRVTTHGRKKGAKVQQIDPEKTLEPTDGTDFREQADLEHDYSTIMQWAEDNLPSHEYRALGMRFNTDIPATFEEIAWVEGVTHQAVQLRVKNAVQKLKDKFGDLEL